MEPGRALAPEILVSETVGSQARRTCGKNEFKAILHYDMNMKKSRELLRPFAFWTFRRMQDSLAKLEKHLPIKAGLFRVKPKINYSCIA